MRQQRDPFLRGPSPKRDILDSTPGFLGIGCLFGIFNLALGLASIAGAIWVIVTMLRYLEVIS